ncbi:MAG: hypothetical protein PHP00_07200 [Thiotrichaceae bacterium]|nr:hypothetical protein [Thiotrichaceae bacterium]
MLVTSKAFQVKKYGEDECQDAFAVNDEQFKFAVADGATQSFFPSQWSRALVESFCNDDQTDVTIFLRRNVWIEWLKPLQKKWHDQIEHIVQKENKYYLTNRFTQNEPAVSTFVGLHLPFSSKSNNWYAVVVGDSCLIHISAIDFKIKKSYLLERAEQFTSKPDFFASINKANIYDPEVIRITANEGDIFLLATDALAKWLLTQHERGENRWKETWASLKKIDSQYEFNHFIEEKRNSQEFPMDNDDTTLLIVSLNKEKRVDNVQQNSEHFSELEFNEKKQSKKYLSSAVIILIVSSLTILALFSKEIIELTGIINQPPIDIPQKSNEYRTVITQNVNLTSCRVILNKGQRVNIKVGKENKIVVLENDLTTSNYRFLDFGCKKIELIGWVYSYSVTRKKVQYGKFATEINSNELFINYPEGGNNGLAFRKQPRLEDVTPENKIFNLEKGWQFDKLSQETQDNVVFYKTKITGELVLPD